MVEESPNHVRARKFLFHTLHLDSLINYDVGAWKCRKEFGSGWATPSVQCLPAVDLSSQPDSFVVATGADRCCLEHAICSIRRLVHARISQRPNDASALMPAL